MLGLEHDFVRPAPTAENNLKATHLERFYRHHLLEIMLNVIQQNVFILNCLHATAETPAVGRMHSGVRPAQARTRRFITFSVPEHGVDEL